MSGGQIMIVLICAMFAIGGVLKAKYGRRHDAEDQPPRRDLPHRDDADSARLRDEVRTLKERIAVLERIATDRSTSLDHEIERLRDR